MKPHNRVIHFKFTASSHVRLDARGYAVHFATPIGIGKERPNVHAHCNTRAVAPMVT